MFVASTLPGLAYPTSIVRLSVGLSCSIKTESFDGTPDLVISMASKKGPKKVRLPFIVECAFSQTQEHAFAKLKEEIDAHPDVIMVFLVVIKEDPSYHSPQDHSDAWERSRRDVDPLELDAFTTISNDISEVFENPIVIYGHTWCSIRSVDYYVWHQKDGVPIEIDSEDAEFCVHGVCNILFLVTRV